MSKHLLAGWLFAFVVGGCSASPTSTTPLPPTSAAVDSESIPALQGKTADEAGRRSLDAYRTLITADDYESLGFLSLDEATTATLGRAVPIWVVPLDRIRAYDGQADPEGLLVDSGEVLFEVTVEGEVRSSVRVGRLGDLWQGESFGSAAMIQGLAAARSSDDEFVVWVPAMNVYLLARRENGLTVTPAFDYPGFNLLVGESRPAQEVFARLAKVAPTDDNELN